jgi:hypothetical protein
MSLEHLLLPWYPPHPESFTSEYDTHETVKSKPYKVFLFRAAACFGFAA